MKQVEPTQLSAAVCCCAVTSTRAITLQRLDDTTKHAFIQQRQASQSTKPQSTQSACTALLVHESASAVSIICPASPWPVSRTPAHGGGMVIHPCSWPAAVQVTELLPSSLALDTFLARLEIALYAHGFTGSNSSSAFGLHACLSLRPRHCQASMHCALLSSHLNDIHRHGP